MKCETEINGRNEEGRRAARTARRGSCRTVLERYLVLAREATQAGDPIEAENCYQHAEHYFRVMRER